MAHTHLYRGFCRTIVPLLLILAPFSAPIAPLPATAQSILKPKLDTDVVIQRPSVQWEGSQTPRIQMLKGKQTWIEGVNRVFQDGTWIFYANGTFTFTPSANLAGSSDLFPITGTYTQHGNEIQFQAEKQTNPAKVALDGSIRVQGRTATLETLYTVSNPFSQEIAQVSQTLTPPSGSNSQMVIQGISVPSIFEISLQGETDHQSFGPLAGKLQITTPFKGDSNLFAVHLATEPVDAIGSIQWASFPPDHKQAAYPMQINQGEVQIEIRPPAKVASAGVVWFTVTQGSLIPSMPMGAAGLKGTLRFKIVGDRLSGEIQATGQSDFLEQPSTYQAQFVGKRIGLTALNKQDASEQTPVKTKSLLVAASPETSFTGHWKTDAFGDIQLQQTSQQIRGTYTGRGGGTIIGTVQGNRLDFTWNDAQQGEGWGFFRMVAEGQTLAGTWGKGTDKTQIYSVVATRVDLPTSPITLTDKAALRDLAYDLTLKGKCNQAIQPLETVLTLYKQERGQQKTWKILRDGYLIDELNILTRLAFCHHQLEDYEGLLQDFRYTHEVQELLQQIEYLQGFTIPPSDPIKQALDQFQTDWQTRLASDVSKINFLEQGQPFFQTLIESLVELQQYDQALLVSEQGRARALVDLLAAKFAKSMANPLSLVQTQQVVRVQNAVLVEYAVIFSNSKTNNGKASEKSLYIWLVQPNGQITFRVVDIKPLWQKQNTTLTDLVINSRKGIGVIDRGDANVTISFTPEYQRQLHQRQTRYLRQLHQLLIEPIADLLPSNPNQPVIFVPQGELFLVPFPALIDVNGTALIEKHTLLTAPSIQVLDLTRQQRQKISCQKSGIAQALVVGNPTMPKVQLQVEGDVIQLSNLSGAKREAEQIAELLKTRAMTGNQARKSEVVKQMVNACLIHLATHGLLDDLKRFGVPGAIALAPDGTGEPNDGLLMANDILDMQLKAELVVLSACDTGRGKITGDGVIGLSRSLISAGVPSIIVSLWKVPDESTQFLMTEFYQNLQKNSDKAQALRQAMLTTKAKYPNPLDWAAFTLIGEAK